MVGCFRANAGVASSPCFSPPHRWLFRELVGVPLPGNEDGPGIRGEEMSFRTALIVIWPREIDECWGPGSGDMD